MPIYLGNTEIGSEYVDSYQLGNIYLGNNKIQNGNETYIQATGGTITYHNNFKIHTFTTTGSNSLVIQSLANLNVNNNIEYLVVGGGGAGSENTSCGFGCPAIGGSGGAGGTVRTGSVLQTATGSLNIVVGAGGVGGANINGTASVFLSVTASGGTGGTATGSFEAQGGYNADFSGGMANTTPNRTGGGGAGAGENGEGGQLQPIAGSGGDGVASLITGVSTYYGGGGAGAAEGIGGGYTGTGGLGGGGNGTTGSNALGGGGGGKAASSGGGFNGGSGVVIVRYPYQ